MGGPAASSVDYLAGIRGAAGRGGRRRRPTRAGHAAELAAAAAQDRRALVIGLGGDGTLNEIVNGMLGVPSNAPAAATVPLPALGIVATGTGGDFGRSLGIPHELGAYLAALGRAAWSAP